EPLPPVVGPAGARVDGHDPALEARRQVPVDEGGALPGHVTSDAAGTVSSSLALGSAGPSLVHVRGRSPVAAARQKGATRRRGWPPSRRGPSRSPAVDLVPPSVVGSGSSRVLKAWARRKGEPMPS